MLSIICGLELAVLVNECVHYNIINKYSTLNHYVVSLSFAVPSQVLNLTISSQSNGTLLLVTWDDSANPNGIITYLVRITCFDLVTASLTFDESYTRVYQGDLSIEVAFPDGLEPYANYTATAVASTSGGNSSEITDQFTTPQGGKMHTQSDILTKMFHLVSVENV